MNILVIGQTTLHWGRMEHGNIGNFYVLEPFINLLIDIFDGCNISTTLQLSDEFISGKPITVLPMEYYYGFRENELSYSINELNLVDSFLESGIWNEKTGYIDAVLNSDIIIDYSGDIWGDNADFLGPDRFEVGLCKDLVAQKLNKPIYLIAGSPGPFGNPRTKDLAKEVFQNFTLVTNREPISTEILARDGFDVSKVHDLACPAFLFEPDFNVNVDEIFQKAGIPKDERPIIGFILCGWNFISGPFDRWPRDDNEYASFVELIEYLTNKYDVSVCLLSHSNGFPIPPAEFKLIHGRDYPIVKQLQKILQERGIARHVYCLDGVYNPKVTKAIIGRFDMLISGRVHGAVAGLSQFVPTVILDYGHEPKAHKLKGFARVSGVEQFLANPEDTNDMMQKAEMCWLNRSSVRNFLINQIPMVQKKSRDNVNIIKKSYNDYNSN